MLLRTLKVSLNDGMNDPVLFTLLPLVSSLVQISLLSFKRDSSLLFLEKVMAPHSSTLAWEIPWTPESVWLQSMESQSRTRLSTHRDQQETYFGVCDPGGQVQVPAQQKKNSFGVGKRRPEG